MSNSTVAVLTWAVMCICLGLSSCGSQNLTRSKAQAIVVNSAGYPIIQTDTTHIGEVSTSDLTFGSYKDHEGKYESALNDGGVVSLEWKGTHKDPNQILGTKEVGIVNVSLTGDGKGFLIGDENGIDANTVKGFYPRSQKKIKVKMCERRFNSVTGIEMVDSPVGKRARVEYTWSFEERTPFQFAFEKAYGVENTACGPRGTQNAVAILRLFDDGWRFDPSLSK